MGRKRSSRRDFVRRGSFAAGGLAIAGGGIAAPATGGVAPSTQASPAAGTPAAPAGSPTPSEVPTMLTVANEHLAVGFDVGDGLALASLVDKVTGHEYLPASRPASKTSLFLFRIGGREGAGGFYTSRTDLVVDKATLSADRHRLEVTAHGTTVPVSVSLAVTAEAGQPAAVCEFRLRNEAAERMQLQFEYPRIQQYAVPGEATAMGALPIEIGVVGPLGKRPTLESGDVDRALGLPHTMGAMALASVHDANGGGGVFFADLDGGIAPLEFSLSDDQLLARWTAAVEPGKEVALPRLAIGVHHGGDWHEATDYYVQHRRPTWRSPDIPGWLREAGAIYAYGGEGGGGILQQRPTIPLKERVGSFENLPQLLDEATQLGTNVIYLYDYWDGASEGDRPPYWNKGDYVPRADMGGPEAFKAGIARMRARGGRVILYVEPFIVFRYSNLGQEKGEAWAGREPRGSLYAQYPDNYTMCSTFRPWQEYVAEVSRRLVAEFGADGIYLDSYGWQWNWPCFTPESGELISAAEWNRGVLDLIDHVRTTIREVHPEAVVLTEAVNELLAQHVDGGLDASFAWHMGLNGGRILASPMRYAMPQANIYSNGRDLNQLNQVYAAGHNLVLAPHWLADAEYIRPLVEARQRHKDALVDGRQAYQPATGSDAVGAYVYEGDRSRVITAVNVADDPYQGALALRPIDAGSRWRDLVTDEVVSTENDHAGPALPLTIPGEGLRVLIREP